MIGRDPILHVLGSGWKALPERLFAAFQKVYGIGGRVMSMNLQGISPLWEVFPSQLSQEVQAAENGTGVFKDVLRSVVDNLRDSEDEVAKTEYLLSTGQLDNPAQLSMALYKAEVSMSLFVQLREKALSAYSELSRISI